MAPPRISVLMPVFNGERFLRQAMESVLGQSFRDFEFIIIDDGSTDGSAEVISSYGDKRIRLVRNGSNLGLVASLNLGLDLARGEYIARMDADDISLPDRLRVQVGFMERNPAVGVCGSWVYVFSDCQRRTRKLPTDSEVIRCELFSTPLSHILRL